MRSEAERLKSEIAELRHEQDRLLAERAMIFLELIIRGRLQGPLYP
jgi:hypothetical protein